MCKHKFCTLVWKRFKANRNLPDCRSLFIVIPFPGEAQLFPRLKTGVLPAQMPVHLRPCQVIVTTYTSINLRILRPPLAEQSGPCPIVKDFYGSKFTNFCSYY